jgi:alpha-N-arabinofuranosidase
LLDIRRDRDLSSLTDGRGELDAQMSILAERRKKRLSTRMDKERPMKKVFVSLVCFIVFGIFARAAEIHVAVSGSDSNPGTQGAPLRTIQRAADLAQPGDVITVHEGVYRECVRPPRGGESDRKRIVYRAAPGEKVEIKGSEVIAGWVQVRDDVWKVAIPNSLFGGFNPYRDLIRGDWFDPKGRDHHTGAVYLNGEWLAEAAKLEDVLGPMGETPLWFGQVDQDKTTIWAQFKGVDPNDELIEINVRRTVFYPEKTGVNYLTVRGFIMRHAATPWAPPTAEQVGLIGTHWSKGWIIEKNVISHSVCSGIALGKYGDEFDNTSRDTAEGYVKTIERALENGWNKETIGHHLVRDNTISHCEQAGIVGSLGAAFSTVTGNTIRDIHVRRLFSGAEMAGIKFHGAIDVEISHNHIFRTTRGLWLDWMAQGTRVTANLFHENRSEDLFVEVNHGPFLVDNNIFLSPTTLLSLSQGGAYVHNLVGGAIRIIPYDARQTPFQKAHSTEVAGMHDNPFGDDRYYNNLFVGSADLSQYDAAPMAAAMDGNVFLRGATPSSREKDAFVDPDFDPSVRLVEKSAGFYLEISYDRSWEVRKHKRVTAERLGKAAISGAAYESPDGTPASIKTDFFGRSRNGSNPTPGPFEIPGTGRLSLKVRPLHAPK